MKKKVVSHATISFLLPPFYFLRTKLASSCQ